MSDARDVQVRMGYGEFFVLINEEGVAHSPDVLDDLCKRALTLFREGWAAIPEIAEQLTEDADDDAEAVTGDDEA